MTDLGTELTHGKRELIEGASRRLRKSGVESKVRKGPTVEVYSPTQKQRRAPFLGQTRNLAP